MVMATATLPVDELWEPRPMEDLSLKDASPDSRLDRVSRLAQTLFDVPIAMISLIDEHRQWFCSQHGTAMQCSPGDVAFCGHTILSRDTLIVEDALLDDRFARNPLVTSAPYLRFYAGQPIQAPTGGRLGALCLMDTRPRTLTREQVDTLKDLGSIVEDYVAAKRHAEEDELTGLLNRRGFESRARAYLAHSAERQRSTAVLFLDLDNFKQINDRFGHRAGDQALADFGRAVRRNFRDQDLVARYGGDEFALLLPNCSREDALAAVDRLQDDLAASATDGIRLHFSFGLAFVQPGDLTSFEDAMARADEIMYRVKHQRAKRF